MRPVFFLAALLLSGPVFAHHPEDRLDEVIAEKESAFEATDIRRPPELDAVDAAGEPFNFKSFSNQVLVLSFVPEACGALCAAQQTLLARVRGAVNLTPMRDMVSFIVAAEAGEGNEKVAVPDVIAVGPSDGTTVSALAARFGELSSREDTGPQVHLIDRGGRHAGIFHGAKFGYLNMVLYINGLTNARPPERGFLDRILELIR